ncbi:MAG: AmmeMemoRadiSam system radical SAM enzyme [Candidatus Magnetoovum sp. WYHC-5]|nr:AmmeMemoRadiSam system radical SAM enzyme [Candidatus Magnetoovum sp. WYHC-5]
MAEKKLSRREFIKKTVIATAGAGIGLHTIKGFYLDGNPSEFSRGFRNDVPDALWRWSREASHYKTLSDGSIECKLCPHECRLGADDRGFCRTRVNKGNKLYTLAYGNPCTVHIDPVEKKPLFHYLPGTIILSIATAGCNLRCLNCQNWSISQFKPEETLNREFMPEAVVETAIKINSPSIAYTYSEPIIYYEYTMDVSRAAKAAGLKNVWVSAGYINEKPLREAAKFMDAANFDIKVFNDAVYKKLCQAHLQPVMRGIEILKEENVWFEITRLVVPVLSDDREDIKKMCEWICARLGPETPLHLLRFHPDYKLRYLPPTSVEQLIEFRKLAMDSGLLYVYAGNVPGFTEGQTTFCPRCKMAVIKRSGFLIIEYNLKDGQCTNCNEKIAGIWGI